MDERFAAISSVKLSLELLLRFERLALAWCTLCMYVCCGSL